mmetsp:Transcript_80228/g.129987  ORF Transcript_80228/g.129987 Transcript_80228/m.129987 type:complete len:163 (+) Transcript_80228:37-525(+)
MLRVRASSTLVRGLTAAAVPAMASCFILSAGPSALTASVVGRTQLSGPAPFAQSFMSTRQSAMPLRGTGLRMMSGTAEGDSVVAGMVKKLEKEFTPVKLEVIPAYGDPNGSHVTINVVSDAFEGKRPVQRQQLVYKVIWEEMQGAVHAVDSMTCKTPKEAGL